MTWLDRFACALVGPAAIQAVPVVEDRLNVAAVSDPPVLTPEDVIQIDEESRMLSEAFRDRTRSMHGVGFASDKEPLRVKIRELELEHLVILADHDETADEARIIRAHLERVLAIVSEIGGYMSPEHQEVIGAAREAVR